MNTATHPDRPVRLPGAAARRRFVAVLGTAALFLLTGAGGCWITDVQQPSAVAPGGTVDITVSVVDSIPDVAAYAAVLAIKVPDDWDFVDATYTSDLGDGDLLLDQDWADFVDEALPAGAGMMWIAMVTDDEYLNDDPPTFGEAQVELEAGQTEGTFGLDYVFTTTAATDPSDILTLYEAGLSDTLLNRPITVTNTTASEDGAQPRLFTLAQNSPNPFAGATTVGYALARAADVRVALYDLAGREVAVLAEGRRAPGEHAVALDARRLPAGTYLYRLEVDGEVVASRRMTLAR